MLEALLAIMTALAPEAPRERLEHAARAIAAAAHTREEIALLVTIDLYETRFEREGLPFGLFSWRHRMRGQSLTAQARAALEFFGFTERCGSDIAVRLGWYHTGHCRADSFSTREARTYRDVLRDLPRGVGDPSGAPEEPGESSAPPAEETASTREGASAGQTGTHPPEH